MKKILLFILFPLLSFAQISPGFIPLSTNASPVGNYTWSGTNGFNGVVTFGNGANILPATDNGFNIGSASLKVGNIFSNNIYPVRIRPVNDATGIGFYNGIGTTQHLQVFGATGNFVYQTGSTFTDIPSAKVAINSTTQGFLVPRMTTTQKNAISSPSEGLIVYDLTLHKLTVYTGSVWESITSL